MDRPDAREQGGSTVGARLPLSPVDFHLLLVLADRDLYGYAIMKAIERQSGGTLRPEIGSLYRMIGRLEREGLLERAGDAVPDADDDPSPGRPRKYYRITELGREVLEAEATRLRRVIALAERRDLIPGAREP